MSDELKNKRYLLFGGDTYYPCGGMSDLSGSFDTLEAAEESAKNQEHEFDWYHIYDSQTGETKNYF